MSKQDLEKIVHLAGLDTQEPWNSDGAVVVEPEQSIDEKRPAYRKGPLSKRCKTDPHGAGHVKAKGTDLPWKEGSMHIVSGGSYGIHSSME